MAPIALNDTVQPEVKAKAVTNKDTLNEDAVQAALSAAAKRFEAANPKSKAQHDIAAGILPGGNTRSLLHTSPFPLSMKCGKGPFVWDEDDHKYVVWRTCETDLQFEHEPY
jgi:hypothetical protein